MIETRLELYEGFYDHAWAQDMVERVPSQISGDFDSLCLAWKEAANTHRLPWLMIHQMEQFAGGFMRRSKPDMAVLIGKFRDWMLQEMGGELRRGGKKKGIAAGNKKDPPPPAAPQ